MSLLYRAVWGDTPATQIVTQVEQLKSCGAAWVQETDQPLPLTEGQSEFDVSQDRHRVVEYRELDPEGDTIGFELVAKDSLPGAATVWTTVLRVVSSGDKVLALVENGVESDDPTLRVSVGRPKVVHELLTLATRPRLGGSGLPTEALPVPASEIAALLETLADSARTLPVIVCSEPAGIHDGSWLYWAKRVQARTEGIAIVVTLDTDAVAVFRSKLGDLAVWDGTVRVYAPTPVTPGAEGWRHRYYLRYRLEDATQSVIDRIVYSVAQLSTRRRVPEEFGAFVGQTGLPADALEGMIPAAQLEKERQNWELEREMELIDRGELEKELARANGHLARLKSELLNQALGHILWGTQHEVLGSIPDEVQDTSEAVLAAQTYLSDWLVIPDSAPRELDDIDAAPNAYAWGNTAWRGFRALAAYAEDRANGWSKGGFWAWCSEGPLLGWPATTKKLSMSESETVQNSTRLSATRIFKVGSSVHPSGQITMLAHLKISEGGGPLAPRVYFHDDTGGSTGKVHVGLVGPHHLVPNKSTN